MTVRKYATRNDSREQFRTNVQEWKQPATIPKHDPEADINVIYRKTQLGQNVNAAKTMPTYGDFSNLLQYDAMLEAMNAAQDAFNNLSAEERRKYHDSPREYYDQTLQALKDDAATKEAIEEAQAAFHKKEADLKAAIDLVRSSGGLPEQELCDDALKGFSPISGSETLLKTLRPTKPLLCGFFTPSNSN